MTAALTIRDFALLTAEESAALFDAMTPQERASKLYDWSFWARPEQLEPAGVWSTWLALCGRGWGKTEAGAQWIRHRVANGARSLAIVAETQKDLEEVMVPRIVKAHPPGEAPSVRYKPVRVKWANGALALGYNGTEPNQLRGPEFDTAWVDELAKYRAAQDVWDMLQFTMRVGDPRVLVTTTPRPTAIIKAIVSDRRTIVMRGNTLDNAPNLPPEFVEKLVERYGGTRLGRQEINAELLEDVPGALFNQDNIDKNRIRNKSGLASISLRRIVVAVDPAITSGEDSDETGVVVCGVDDQHPPHGYVLDDVSGIYAPAEWAKKALHMYHKHKADRIVAEINQGGEMVEATIRMFNANVPYKGVHASRGKVIRAEPVSGLYEQNRVHHVGIFADLETQLCAFTSDFDKKKSGYSPDRLDAMVWAMTELMVEHQNDGIIQFYCEQVDTAKAMRAAVNAPPDPAMFIRLRCPPNISTVYGAKGNPYLADADGCVSVAPSDVGPLRAAGFFEVAGELKNTA